MSPTPVNRNSGVPSSRRAAAGIVQEGRFYIYGGFGVAATVKPHDVGRDLWRYSDRWELVDESGPIAARYPSLCLADREIWLFGGCSWDGMAGMVFSNRLYRRRGKRWERVSTEGAGPQGRYTSLMAPSAGGICIFGGHSQDGKGGKTFYGDLWIYDLSRSRWEKIHDEAVGPGPRYGFGWTVGKDAAWLCGGFDGVKDRGDLWRFNLSSLDWELAAPEGDVPLPRYCPSLGMVSGEVVLFGGRSKVRPRENFDDTWRFGKRGWERLKSYDSPGYHAKSAYASDGQRMYLFGGEGPKGHVSDLWRFDSTGWVRLQECRDDDPVLW